MSVKQKTCPRCGITCDASDSEAIDDLFGFRMYKNAEYQQSQCKKCRSKEPAAQIIVDAIVDAEAEMWKPIKVYPACINCRDMVVHCPHPNVVELKPCERDNQPMVKFPIASEPTQLERDLLKSLYVRTYPRDKEGVKRSYKFMWNKLHKRGLV